MTMSFFFNQIMKIGTYLVFSKVGKEGKDDQLKINILNCKE